MVHSKYKKNTEECEGHQYDKANKAITIKVVKTKCVTYQDCSESYVY